MGHGLFRHTQALRPPWGELGRALGGWRSGGRGAYVGARAWAWGGLAWTWAERARVGGKGEFLGHFHTTAQARAPPPGAHRTMEGKGKGKRPKGETIRGCEQQGEESMQLHPQGQGRGRRETHSEGWGWGGRALSKFLSLSQRH